MDIHRLNATSVAARLAIPFRTHRVVVSSPVEKLVRRVRESFLAFTDLRYIEEQSRDHLQVIHGDSCWHILRNGNVLQRAPSLRHAARRTQYAVINSLIVAHPELIWLHAGAVVKDGQAILFLGNSCAGKSTLVTELSRRGWSYASDDVVPVRPDDRSVESFPMTPSLRVGMSEDGFSYPGRNCESKFRDKEPLLRIASGPNRIAAVILLRYRYNVSPRLGCLTAQHAETELLGRVMNHCYTGSSLLKGLTRLAADTPVYDLEHSGNPGAVVDFLIEETGLGGMQAACAKGLLN